MPTPGPVKTDDVDAPDNPGVPGEHATTPTEIPWKGWWQIVRRSWKEAQADQVPLMAAGVAFYAFLSLFPALIALVLVYALVADPKQLTEQVSTMTQALPADAQQLITTQLESVAQSQTRAAGVSAVIAFLLALWSAAGGVGNLITAINAAYDEEETRGFVKRKALALLMTLGSILFMVLALLLVAGVPAILNQAAPSDAVRLVVQVIRWPLLIVLVAFALAVLYRYSASRDAPKVRWVSIGAITATILWLLASVGFSIYVANFGSYAKTYGALAGVVVLLLWLWITSYAVLLGAEVNAESEQQTAADTTKGTSRPRGARGAVKADSQPGDPGTPR